MFDEDEAEEVERDPAPWSWATFWSIITAGMSAYFTLIGAMISDISDAIEGHGEYGRRRKAFAERAALEIEALTREPAPVGK